ncbi:hypothetical protein KAZ92_02485, partial [Candidatus Gracilibacteria bacterium]|nr:hypothetical protein [Candidatus Gracilibacteria bacterium]
DEFIDIFNVPPTEDASKTDHRPDGKSAPKNVDQLAEILVTEFIHSLRVQKQEAARNGKTSQNPVSPSSSDLRDVFLFRAELITFIKGYHQTKHTLHDFLVIQRQLYPHVDIHLIFQDPEINTLLIQQISRSSLPEIKSTYVSMYREDPSHFIAQYLNRRVLAPLSNAEVTIKTLDRVTGNIDRLLQYLVEQGYQLEDLYMLIYKEFTVWRHITTQSKNTRSKVEQLHPALLAEPNEEQDAGMLDPRFNFDAFFNKHFRPAIIKARSKELPKKPRHIDLQVKGWDLLLAPPHAMDPFREMADLAIATDPTVFSTKLRRFFGYPLDPGKLSDEKMDEILSRQLKIASTDQIKSTLEEGLRLHPKEGSIHKDFAFCTPIIECNDIRSLTIWFAYPDRFIKAFPEFGHIRPEVISLQARRMIEHLLLYRGSVFSSEFKDRKKKRDRIEGHLKEALSIQVIEKFTQHYRVLVQVDPDTHEPILSEDSSNYYDVLIPGTPEWNACTKGKRANHEFFVEKDGLTFKALPVEKRKFIATRIAVPQPHGAPREMDVLFYSDDDNLLDIKSVKSFLLSLIRGKLPTDLVRCMMVFPPDTNEDDKQILLDFLYDYASHVVKLEHHKESRQIGKQARTSRSNGSASFSDDRLASFSGYAVFLEQLPDDEKATLSEEDIDALLHGRYGFEIQVMDINSVCITASHFTISSHNTAYAPERAFNVVTKKYVPPVVMGSKYANYALSGFRGKKHDKEE